MRSILGCAARKQQHGSNGQFSPGVYMSSPTNMLGFTMMIYSNLSILIILTNNNNINGNFRILKSLELPLTIQKKRAETTLGIESTRSGSITRLFHSQEL